MTSNAPADSILWRRIDVPGHEAARIFLADSHWHLDGTALFLHDDRPCRLDYRIRCDESWRTLSTSVSGWLGDRVIELEISAESGRWMMNRAVQSAVDGCIDVDLNFSPSTNLLPIRRLNLKPGEAAEVQAAWLRFPSFELERLTQEYSRVDETTYRYSSAGGRFVAELQVNDAGFVTDYASVWQAVTRQSGGR